ncbi:addiction module antidote protein [uncultured Desulfovibrio sp.]|uniref:addiction module antidote protein n=1 Tax=uncultured Desulfovibrio sp. TaxID=167968 RepID=UPI00039FFA37|nr:addiction module antidote protein [uncultured Desulfovibrio sp.]
MNKELLEVSKFDAADYLHTDDDVRGYLEEVVSEDDPHAFLRALNTVARAKGMSKLAQDTGIPRESLYQSLSEKGNPSFHTLWKVAAALGCTLVVKRKMPA